MQQSRLSNLGTYGHWAASLIGDDIPSYAFRHPRWTTVEQWREVARLRFLERIAGPDLGAVPVVNVDDCGEADGLVYEVLSWQLPAGPRTEAVLLKPAGSSGRLPGVVALHDHGSFKYAGWRKIAHLPGQPVEEWQRAFTRHYYGGVAWANELARRGFVVLAPDAFLFGSRRLDPRTVPPSLRSAEFESATDEPARREAYNVWAGSYEHVISKALLCAGTTWPGVFVAEDRIALEVLVQRPDVDPGRIGCGGLSGGGLRTVFLSAVEPRVRCAVCAGMMFTWRDLLHTKASNHTWMCYVPLLPRELDYPDVFALRAPLPALSLFNSDDELFTLSEMQRAHEMLRVTYSKAGASQRYDGHFFPGAHKFDLPMQREAFAWFERWL